MSIKTAKVTTLIASSTDVPNGMVLNNEGKLLVCQQGSETRGGYIQEFNPKIFSATTIAADNWFGIPFNSPNDVVVKKDGSVWFTDPSYGRSAHFHIFSIRVARKLKTKIFFRGYWSHVRWLLTLSYDLDATSVHRDLGRRPK